MWKKIIYIAIVSLIALNACEKDQTKAVVLANPTAPVIISPASGTSFVFKTANKDSSVLFVWKEAEFGFSASVSYLIQYASENGLFAQKSNLLSSVNNNDSALVKINSFDSKIIKDLKLDTAVKSTIKIRIAAVVSTELDTVFSPSILLSIKPY